LRLAHDAHLEPELLAERHHFAEHVAVGDRDVVRLIVRHERIAIDAHVGRHERPLARRAVPPGVALFRR
jgi:hypothetical protein